MGVILMLSRDHHDRYMTGIEIITQRLNKFHTIHLRHHEVSYHYVRHPAFRYHLQSLAAVAGVTHVILRTEIIVYVYTQLGIVLHHEYLPCISRAGRLDLVLAHAVCLGLLLASHRQTDEELRAHALLALDIDLTAVNLGYLLAE